MKVIVTLNYGLLVRLIWLPVISSVPVVEFDVWADREESGNRVAGSGEERNWSVVEGRDLSRVPRGKRAIIFTIPSLYVPLGTTLI